MLIIADGEDVRDLVPTDDPSIRLIHLDRADPIGDKRNFGCERADGEIIVHFDDDDWSAPGRVADQVARLATCAKAVTGYRRLRFTDGPSWWLYKGMPESVPGTTQCYRRDWWERHHFPRVQLAEDIQFAQAAHAAGELDRGPGPDAGELMYATIHAQNTSPRQLSGPSWQKLETAA